MRIGEEVSFKRTSPPGAIQRGRELFFLEKPGMGIRREASSKERSPARGGDRGGADRYHDFFHDRSRFRNSSLSGCADKS